MKTLSNARTTVVATIVALASVLILAACGGPTTTTESKATFNDADVEFVSGMIPHHEQAVVMSEWAESRAEDAKVKDLAKRITDAQGPEIKTMTGWLKAWDQPVPDAYDPDAAGADHSGHSMDMSGMDAGGGMMSAEDMATLKKSTGAAFDQEYLKQMIMHHKGAVTMARSELADGVNPDAKKLAKAIVSAQTAEIDEMGELLE